MCAGWDRYCLMRVYDLTTTICAKEFITYIRVTVPVHNVLVADVFGIGTCHWHLVPINRCSYSTPPFSFIFPHFLTPQVSVYGNRTVNTCSKIEGGDVWKNLYWNHLSCPFVHGQPHLNMRYYWTGYYAINIMDK